MYQAAREAYLQGRLEGALTLIDRAFELHDAPTLLLARAYVLDRLMRVTDARQAYTTYLRRRPDDPERASIERRVSQLEGARATLGFSGRSQAPYLPADNLAPAEERKPEKPKPPTTHDGPFFLRPSVHYGAVRAGRTDRETALGRTEELELDYADSVVGIGIALGGVLTPGVALAVEGQASYSAWEYSASGVDPYTGEQRETSGDDEGLGLAVSLDLHVFTGPHGGLHLNTGLGYILANPVRGAKVDGSSGEAFDSVANLAGHIGIGWAFWLSDQLALDPLVRLAVLPDGDSSSSLALLTLDVGLLWD